MKEDIQRAAEVLLNGGVILYPTDTIWGLGCDPTDKDAVNRIYNIKKRDDTRSMLVLVDSTNQLMNYVDMVPDLAFDLIDLSENPITIIYSGAKNFATNLISSDGSIGIRISRDLFNLRLINKFKKPIVSTSANISGNKAPGTFKEINQEIIDSVDYVVNWRQEETKPSIPSSIIKLGIKGEIKILRK